MTANKKKQNGDMEVFSRPVITMKQEFRSQAAQYIVQKSFEGMDRALFYFAGHFLNQGMDEERLGLLQDEINTRFEEFIGEANDEIKRLQAVLKEAGVMSVPSVGYTKPEKLNVGISNPFSRKFLAMVVKLDDLCRVIDAAWITGAIDAKQRKNATFNYRNRLRKMTAQTRGELMHIRAALRKELDREAVAAEQAKKEHAAIKANAKKLQAKPAAKKQAAKVTTSNENQVDQEEKVEETA